MLKNILMSTICVLPFVKESHTYMNTHDKTVILLLHNM